MYQYAFILLLSLVPETTELFLKCLVQMLGPTGIDLFHLQLIANSQVRCFVPLLFFFFFFFFPPCQLSPRWLYFWTFVLCIHTNFCLLQLFVSMTQIFTLRQHLSLPDYCISKNISTAVFNLKYKTRTFQYAKLISPYIMYNLFNSIE